MEDKVCAVVVTYDPPRDLPRNVQVLAEQVTEVVIVDNGFSDSRTDLEIVVANPRITVIRNRRNLGLAAAFNQGLEYGLIRKYQWLATFDQDSRAPKNYFQTLFNGYQKCPFRDSVAVISPAYADKRTGEVWPSHRKYLHLPYRERITTLSSGSVIKAEILQACGMFREDFFIDYIDHEFCLRVRSKGLKVIEVPSAILQHNLGCMSSRRILGREIFFTNHSPLRRYYMSRNRLTTAFQYLHRETAWVINDLIATIKEAVKIVFFEDRKGEKFRSMAKGAWHALRGKLGPHAAHLP